MSDTKPPAATPETTRVPGAEAKVEAKAEAKVEAKAEGKAGTKTGGKTETKAGAGPEAEAGAKGNAKPGATGEARPAAAPAPFLLIGVVVGACALGAAVGAVLIGPRIVAARAASPQHDASPQRPGNEGKKAEGKSGRSAKAVVYRLENLIVNPAGSQGSRFLMATVVFELPDDKVEAQLRDHEVEVRDAVISTLESQTMELLTRPGARDSVKRQLTRVVTPLAGNAAWLRVYLPQFVIQ